MTKSSLFSQISPLHKGVWGTEQVICGIGNTHILKFLQTVQPTSVQIHPRSPGILPEQDGEIWWITHAETKSRLYIGFSKEVNRQEVVQHIQNGKITSLMCSYQPVPGDCFVVPAGTIHALGGGISLLEIRPENASTFRLYDWGREKNDHTERKLHFDEALSILNIHVLSGDYRLNLKGGQNEMV